MNGSDQSQGDTQRVILSGRAAMPPAHYFPPVPYDVQDYFLEGAWQTGANVWDVPQEQYDRWMTAKKEHQRMQAEIRDLLRERRGY